MRASGTVGNQPISITMKGFRERERDKKITGIISSSHVIDGMLQESIV